MGTINWNNIRAIGSQENGFEELVCQLAATEKLAGQKKFWRIGKPDAGKECYWEHHDGSLTMWQAKYFLTSPTQNQWTQIDSSVHKAIDNHSLLKVYYVCLPLDMPDGKVAGKKSMLSKWNEKVKEWQTYANSKGMTVDFEYWGSSQLTTRLIKRENEGMAYYWFNQEEFTDDWFNHRNNEGITALGARYTKELTIELPLGKVFDGLARDDDFQEQAHQFYEELLDKYRRIRLHREEVEIKELVGTLDHQVRELRSLYESVEWIGNEPIPIDELHQKTIAIHETIEGLKDEIYKVQAAKETKEGRKDPARPFAGDIDNLRTFDREIYRFGAFLSGITCGLANKPYLILTGGAGMGKSHLLADIIEKRKGKGHLSLLLLGENFSSKELPWTQILNNQLRKQQLDEFIFLGALNAMAESRRSRIILFVDAINEGEGRIVWKGKLKSFMETIGKYPWLGVVVSLRSSFERLLAPPAEVPEGVALRINHEGFLGMEHEAASRFLEYYGIMQPGTPLLDPEFQNPLFLKLFCQSLLSHHLSDIPEGYEGFTLILESFLDGIDEKLAQPDQLHYDEKLKLVRKAVQVMVQYMADRGKDFVPYDAAADLVNTVFGIQCTAKEPYLKRLISEGVFNLDSHWEAGVESSVIYFAYQRFQDHLLAELLLDKYLDRDKPEDSFTSGPLHDLMVNPSIAAYNQNLLEALSILVPERVNKELFEVAPHAAGYPAIAEAFINSLIWRKKGSLGENSGNYLRNTVGKSIKLSHRFLEISISACMKKNYYFDAESLHKWLLPLSLCQRDQIWTTWLQEKYGPESAPNSVKTLIDWAWGPVDKTRVSDASITSGCITLAWLLTSCNRYLRDSATKAMINLLQDRLHLLPALLLRFDTVNDSYVLERLYAVANGCTLRTKQKEALVPLSECIYQLIFNKETVYPHILLRDYAREVIEYTLHLGLAPAVDQVKFRPPHKSEPFPKKLPSNTEIDKKYRPRKGKGIGDRTARAVEDIIKSMTTEYGRGTAQYGDFGRYTFEAAFSDWKIDANKLSNYALQRIFEMGYDGKIFGEFDSNQGSGRGAGHKERIGKKYQWLALYELLARASDNCILYDESTRYDKRKRLKYDGPWYPYVRDIDPSILIKKIQGDKDYRTIPVAYEQWNSNVREWIKSKTNIPEGPKMISLIDKEGQEWLWLEVHPSWEEPHPLGEDKHHSKRENLWFQIRSYFVKNEDLPKFIETASKNHSMELPEARSMYSIFSREYYWSPAFNFFSKPYYGGKTWIEVYEQRGGKPVGTVHRTTEHFLWEEEFDCSKDMAIGYYKPTRLLMEGLQLSFSTREGELIDITGAIICKDPSVNENLGSGLLVKRKPLEDFLLRENLSLFWNIIGQKAIHGDTLKDDYNGRQEIHGIYTLSSAGIVGKWNFKTYGDG